jgi:hypothetical protein
MQVMPFYQGFENRLFSKNRFVIGMCFYYSNIITYIIDLVKPDVNEKIFKNSYFQTRRISLEDASKLFKFYRECDEFETWMKEKELLLTSKESLSDNMDAVRKKFEVGIQSLNHWPPCKTMP